MKTKQKVFWVFGPSVFVTGIGEFLISLPDNSLTDSIGGIILLPGWLLCVLMRAAILTMALAGLPACLQSHG
jgi:hypothetical protein